MESNLVQRDKLEEHNLLQQRIIEILHTRKCKKVRELVDAISSESYVSIEKIQEATDCLESDGKVVLIEPPIQGSFFNHLTNYSSNLPFWLSVAAISLSLIAIYLFPNVGTFQIIRIVAGCTLVLIIPGFGLIGSLFPKKDISITEQMGAGVILSLAILLVLWLVLNHSLLGAGTNSVVLCTSALGIILIGISTYRQFLFRKTSRTKV